MRAPLDGSADAEEADPGTAPTEQAVRRKGFLSWTRRHPVLSSLGVVLVLTGAVVAGVVLRQDVTVNPAAATPDVVFAAGSDYTAINAAGFATITLGSSATSATMAVSGIPGAASLSLSNVLNLTNQDGSQGYTATLIRSTTLDAAITDFTVTVKTTGGSTVATWDASSSSSSSGFSLPVSTTYYITVDLVIADGTSVGSLSSFAMQVQLVPA